VRPEPYVIPTLLPRTVMEESGLLFCANYCRESLSLPTHLRGNADGREIPPSEHIIRSS